MRRDFARERVSGLQNHWNAQVNKKDNEGRAALINAAAIGNAFMVEKLLIAGADVCLASAEGKTALDVAIMNRREAVILLLLQEGAPINQTGVTELHTVLEHLAHGRDRLLDSALRLHCAGARLHAPVYVTHTTSCVPERQSHLVLSKFGRLFSLNATNQQYDTCHIHLRGATIRLTMNGQVVMQNNQESSQSILGALPHSRHPTHLSILDQEDKVHFIAGIHQTNMGKWYLEIAAAQCALERQCANSTVVDVGGNPAPTAEIRNGSSDQAVVMPADPGPLGEVVEAVPTHGIDDLAQLLAPLASTSGQDLGDLMKAVTPLEISVNCLAQRLNQAHQVIRTDVQASVQLTDTCKGVDQRLQQLADSIHTGRQKCSSSQASLQAAGTSKPGDIAVKALAQEKDAAEQVIESLLTDVRKNILQKLELTKMRQQQKDNVLSCLLAAEEGFADLPSGSSHSTEAPSAAETQAQNVTQLQASLALFAAYRATADAGAHLQQCLQNEQKLLTSLEVPLQHCLAQSVQLMRSTADALQQEDPQRELRHTEMLLRDNVHQMDTHVRLRESKSQARAAMTGMAKQHESHKALEKQLIRARADHDELIIDGKEREAQRAAEKVAHLKTAQAEVAARMSADRELLASPELLRNHPELEFERVASQGALPLLGAAQRLLKNLQLSDFRVIAHTTAAVSEAEDSTSCRWALKRIPEDNQSVREAERLVKLKGHPLIVPLESVFVDRGITYLQMPFYRRGNLRTWVEQMKDSLSTAKSLSSMQKATVRSTMRQLAQAIAFVHQQGIAHRDIKPENVLLQNNGNIALCDFGISKDIISNAYESTVSLAVAAGTYAYCAPEAGDATWKACPTAVDAWAFGIMLLEVVSGKLFSWVGDKVAYQPGRLQRALTLSRNDLPTDDVWFNGAWDLVEQLLSRDPKTRPSMDAVLLSPFFTSDRFAAGTGTTNLDLKFRTLSSHLSSIRQSVGRTPAHTIKIGSEQTVMADMLRTFADGSLPLQKAFSVLWGPRDIRKPLQEIMDMFLVQLKQDPRPVALFQQCDQPAQLLRNYFPPIQRHLSDATVQQYTACGRILAKCLLEGIHVPITFCQALHCMLVNNPGLSNHVDECCAMLAGFDPEEAQRLRQMLAARHGDGTELLLTVGNVLGNEDETMLTDGNKEEVACRKVRQHLVEDRRPALDAIREGFCSLDIADDIEHLSGLELATLFFGEQYLDVDRLVAAIQAEDDGDARSVKDWLERFIRSLSENSIRVFLARSTNKLALPQPGTQITLEALPESSQPRFIPEASHMQLPKCTTFEAFASRMATALRLGDYALRTDAQNEQRLTREEEQAVMRAMGGEIRAGGYYRCACGYIYAIGECGGPMQQANCPKCGSTIGGEQHRLAAGNQHAAFDGAAAAAWPQ